MHPDIRKLKQELNTHKHRYTLEGTYPILELLWRIYAAHNPRDNGQIREASQALSPILQAMPLEDADHLFDLISDLCTAYQRAAYLDGILLGATLIDELTSPLA